MGKPSTSAERMRAWRKKKENRSEENEKKRERYQEKKKKMTEQQLDEKRENDRLRKAMSRKNQSRQKKQGIKLIDRNRKRRERHPELFSNDCQTPVHNTSTERVRKHREKKKLIITLPFTQKTTKKVRRAAGKIKDFLPQTPNSKTRTLINVINSQSPITKTNILSNMSSLTSTPQDVDFTLFNTLKRKRDRFSNCARQLVVKAIADQDSKKARKMFHHRRLRHLSNYNNADILKHFKSGKSYKKNVDPVVKEKIHDFYEKDIVSRVLPYKNLTKKIKLPNGNKIRVSVRVMEMTLNDAFQLFLKEHPDIKISRRGFEKQRPKHIRLKKDGKRLVCACTYHVNIDYLRKAVNNLLTTNNKPNITDNADLITKAICDPDRISCIAGLCKECKNFKKLDELSIQNLHCSKQCITGQIDCSAENHTIKVNVFERADYLHKGKTKKKIQLIEKNVTPKSLVELLKEKLKGFACHRFNVSHTNRTYDQAIAGMSDKTIIKIQDFSENYTCLLPDEIMSIHWTQEQATVYPVVVLRKIDNDIREDHFTFISNDIKHDVPFVELCNSMIHSYYDEKGVDIEMDVEFNDGCASQYKCIKAIQSFATRKIPSVRVYFETSHGKSKSDGLGGVVKGYASRDVAASNTIIRNASELYQFCNNKLTVIDSDQHKKMLNRIFFFVPKEDIQHYRTSFSPGGIYKHVEGTRKIHQIMNVTTAPDGIFKRNFSCLCQFCYDKDYENCIYLDDPKFVGNIQQVKPVWEVFKKKGEKSARARNESNDDSSSSEDSDSESEDEIQYEETEASCIVKCSDVAVIRTGDKFPYYLVKLTKDPFCTNECIKDDYGHFIPANTKVIEGHYYEVFKEVKEGDLYYLDTSKSAIVSCYSVVGICPEFVEVEQMRKKKIETMFLVTHEMHQLLHEYAICEF